MKLAQRLLVAALMPLGCGSDAGSGAVRVDGSAAGASSGGATTDAGWPDAAASGGNAGSGGTAAAGGASTACTSPGAVHYTLDLSLTSAQEIALAVPGAMIGGGTFDAGGWTPHDRAKDILILPLPENVDTRRGRIRLDVQGLDITPNADCEEFQIVSLDYRAEPYSHGDPERARFDLLHLGDDDDCNTGGVHREGRFELGANLRGCAADNDVPCGINLLTPTDLATAGASYAIDIRWDLTQFDLTLWRDGAEVFAGGATAQMGELQAERMYLILNQCAGGSWARCGLGPTYPAEAGGMSGTTFSGLKLELACP
jgi:hypothetical protein